MDEDATWYGDRPRTRRHYVRWGPSCHLPKKGAEPPPEFSAHVYRGHGRPSQLLLSSCKNCVENEGLLKVAGSQYTVKVKVFLNAIFRTVWQQLTRF